MIKNELGWYAMLGLRGLDSLEIKGMRPGTLEAICDNDRPEGPNGQLWDNARYALSLRRAPRLPDVGD